MWVFPLAAAVLSFVFAGSLARRWRQRRRGYEVLWALSLVMYGVASLAMAVGLLSGWSELTYRLFWLFGAVLNVPYLAQGELMLVSRRRWLISAFMVVLVVGTVAAVWAVFSAAVDPAVLESSWPRGIKAFGDDSPAYRMAQVFSYPAYIYLVAASVWSAVKMRGHPDLKNRSVGTILIAVGATVVAIGSGFGAVLDAAWLFSASLAVGMAIMFGGFLRASRPAAAPATVAEDG
jgi:hypothetical protein